MGRYMPWAKIPPNRLDHMPLFGYDLVNEDGPLAWYNGPRGRLCIEKDAPQFWFEDVADAQQAGATAIFAP